MKEDKHILEQAIEAIRREETPPGPSQDLIDATVTKLTEAQRQFEMPSSGRVVNLGSRIGTVRGITRFAAAAVLLIVAGYAVGRISAPRPPDLEQLQEALEPVIRRKVVAQLRADLQSGLATCYDQLSDEMARRHSEDMARFATQTLDAFNSLTSERLSAVIESINAAQTEDRQLFMAALEQMESERRRDTAALASFAVQTEDELQHVAQILASGLFKGPATYNSDHSDIPVERRNK